MTGLSQIKRYCGTRIPEKGMGNMKEYSAPQAEVINFDKDYVAVAGSINAQVSDT